MATPHSTPTDMLSTYRQGRLPAPYLVAKQNKYKLFFTNSLVVKTLFILLHLTLLKSQLLIIADFIFS